MNETTIEWAEYTWNPITGCTPVSEGCQHCYAERMAKRLAGRGGYSTDEPFRVTMHPERLDEPIKCRTPKRVFVCSMGDLFHEDVPDDFVLEVFRSMGFAYWHTFILLTKRPERMRAAIERINPALRAEGRVAFGPSWKHVWLGVTAENQARADERIPTLLQIPAAVHFVSIEPMLGPVDLTAERLSWCMACNLVYYDPNDWELCPECGDDLLVRGGRSYIDYLDWVIVGGETGPGARPMHPDWVRRLRNQCREAGVPFLFKQWGEWAPADQIPHKAAIASPQLGPDRVRWMAVDGRVSETGKGEMQRGDTLVLRVGKRAAGRLLDGEIWDQYPTMEPGEGKPADDGHVEMAELGRI